MGLLHEMQSQVMVIIEVIVKWIMVIIVFSLGRHLFIRRKRL